MKRLAVILLMVLAALGQVQAQKSKIKEEGGNTTPSDSAKAAGIGKAAIRGGQLMQDSRDSLRGADIQPPSDIVDTFGVKEVHPKGKSFLRSTELIEADKRLIAAKALAEKATFDLELAKTDAKVSAKQISEAESQLKQMQDYLALLEAKFTELRYDWEETTGARLEDIKQKEAPEPPKTTKPATKPTGKPATGNKGAIKGGTGK